ncbi:34150_t:CDS:2, partial [Racocetra persica]
KQILQEKWLKAKNMFTLMVVESPRPELEKQAQEHWPKDELKAN